MIGYLKGLVIEMETNYILVETGGIGYLVFVPRQIITEQSLRNSEIALFIYTHVREDQITLFGFSSSAELKLFKLLLSVSGIGPKIAMEVLSTPLSLIQHAIINEDVKSLSRIPGLGKKTAERLILELKNRIENFVLPGQQLKTPFISAEIIDALTSLGYSRYQILKILNQMDEKITSNEEIIRYFLQNV